MGSPRLGGCSGRNGSCRSPASSGRSRAEGHGGRLGGGADGTKSDSVSGSICCAPGRDGPCCNVRSPDGLCGHAVRRRALARVVVSSVACGPGDCGRRVHCCWWNCDRVHRVLFASDVRQYASEFDAAAVDARGWWSLESGATVGVSSGCLTLSYRSRACLRRCPWRDKREGSRAKGRSCDLTETVRSRSTHCTNGGVHASAASWSVGGCRCCGTGS